MSSRRPQEHVPRVGRKDAVPGREVRPVLGASDAPLSAPLNNYAKDESYSVPAEVLEGYRPQISGAADAVIGAPLSPPPDRDGLQLGVDAAGGYVVPKELDGKKPRRS